MLRGLWNGDYNVNNKKGSPPTRGTRKHQSVIRLYFQRNE